MHTVYSMYMYICIYIHTVYYYIQVMQYYVYVADLPVDGTHPLSQSIMTS